MSKLILFIGCFILSSWYCTESIYSHSVTTIEGITKPLNLYQGKKILIFTLPIEQNSGNDSILFSLDSLRMAFESSLIIIAVPAYEDGFTINAKENLKQWYRSKLSMDIIVTEGLYTRKSSTNNQHPLFRWLTEKSRNDHFETDVYAPGDKFIVWINGELIAVLGAQTRIGSSVVNEILQ